MSILTKTAYIDLCAILDSALIDPRCEVTEFGEHVGWPVGVYALGHRHAGSGQFDIDYVGSAVRRNGDMADRIRDHLGDEAKFELITGQVIFPLDPTLATEEVRRLEGTVARALGVPHLTRRVPGGRRPGRIPAPA